MKKINIAGTHNGQFHADEVFASAILSLVNPNVKIIRTRDPKVLETCDIVYDVGGGEFDHHQNEAEVRENGIPFAAAGLIWRAFGSVITTEEIAKRIDEKLFQGIDAVDNGHPLECDPLITSVSSMIGDFNPTYDSDVEEDEAFQRAVLFAVSILLNKLKKETSKMNAKIIVENALRYRKDKKTLVLDRFCPWTEHLLELDDEKKEVEFVVFPDKSGEYRIQTVPVKDVPFASRKLLPEAWEGLRDDELGDIVGINDAVFCHKKRFIAGAKSFDSIMKMAQIAVRN